MRNLTSSEHWCFQNGHQVVQYTGSAIVSEAEERIEAERLRPGMDPEQRILEVERPNSTALEL